MEIIAVIHARGGSVRVPKKNIKILGGVPLIAWTIRAALKSICQRVIVSTDSEEIANYAITYGAEVPFKRPSNISKDVASELVTQHAVKFHEKEFNKKVKIIVTIQPTTPFLSADDIDSSIDILLKNKLLDSVFTAGPITQRPEWMFQIDEENGIGKKIGLNKIKGDLGVSQNLPKLWHPNGGAYITTRNTLFNKNALIGDNPGIYKMSLLKSIDIDEEIDFIIAENIVKNKFI